MVKNTLANKSNKTSGYPQSQSENDTNFSNDYNPFNSNYLMLLVILYTCVVSINLSTHHLLSSVQMFYYKTIICHVIP